MIPRRRLLAALPFLAMPKFAKAASHHKQAVRRPSYNTGVGFYTLSGRGPYTSSTNTNIYDANGNTFRPRGVNRNHYDSSCDQGIWNSAANCERYVLYWANGTTSAQFVNTYIIPNIINHGIIPIVSAFFTSTGITTSGDTDPATLIQCVDDWIDGVNDFVGASAWKTIEKYMILNIANEWGPQTSTWQSTYITAVQSLRAAGFNCALLIDAPGFGQDGGGEAPFTTTVIPYGPGIIEADPQHNIIFGCHVYFNIQAGQALSYLTPMAQSGLPFIVSEFGPGRNIGPAPTDLTPGELISACEQLGCGWIGWAWDDNNLPNIESDDSGFAMVFSNPPQTPAPPYGGYFTRNPADLTMWGNNIVLATPNGQTDGLGNTISGSTPGMSLSHLAVRCSIFAGGGPS